MKVLPNKLYRQLTPIILFPLLATGLTGIICGFSDRIFPLPEIIINGLMAIHQGLFLGTKIAPIYALLMGLAVFALGLKVLIESKNILLSWQDSKLSSGNIYHLLILIITIPVAFCVETGVAYQIGRDWFGMTVEQTTVFSNIHSGASLGKFLGIVYILTAGLGLIGLSVISYHNSQLSVPEKRKIQEVYPKKVRTTEYIIYNFSPDEVTILRNNVQVGIAIFALLIIAILIFITGKFFLPIIIIVIIFLIPALVIAEKLIKSWQTEKELHATVYERQAESITMLKAVPDTMLRVSQTGICLSYLPGKEDQYLILDEDIVNRHINEFLAPEISQQLLKITQPALDTGSTHFHLFSISIDNLEQLYEARINPIGQTEVLIMIRAIPNFYNLELEPVEQSPNNLDTQEIQLLTESELTEVLEQVLQELEYTPQNHILFCLAIELTELNNEGTFYINDNLMQQIVNKINIYLQSDVIARLDNNGLVILVKDCCLKKASLIVEDLHQSLHEFSDSSANDPLSGTKVNIGLLEINIHSSNATSLMNAAKTTCEMAKQKVNVKTFW